MQQQAAALYRNQEVLTASPTQLVAMLYERAIRSLREAARCIEAGDIEGRWQNNNRAVEILTHLWTTLDLDRGGEVAANLSDLYRFMLKRLGEVDMRNDPAPALEVVGLLEPLAGAWRQLAAQAAKPAPRPAAAAPAPTPVAGRPAVAGGMRFSA